MAETDVHRTLMMDLIQTLQAHYAADPMVYVSGKLLLFYEEGNKRKHISPDVFVVRGVAKKLRENYLTWEEGKGPDLAIELTDKAKDLLGEVGWDPQYGARPLKRAIRKHLEDPLAKQVLAGTYPPGTTIVVDRAPGGELTFSTKTLN